VTDGTASLVGKVTKTQGEWVFAQEPVGEIELPAGASTVKVQIAGKDGRNVMQLERLTLTPVTP
jgi:proline racemase